MNALQVLRDATEPKPVVAIIGGAVAGSEAAAACAARGAIPVVFEQGARPYGKIEDGLAALAREATRSRSTGRSTRTSGTNRGDLRPEAPRSEASFPGRSSTATSASARSCSPTARGAIADCLVEGADAYEGRGLVYQNEFVYWFNHYEDEGYDGPGLRGAGRRDRGRRRAWRRSTW